MHFAAMHNLIDGLPNALMKIAIQHLTISKQWLGSSKAIKKL
jgi:hypothetical protein